MCVEPDHWGTGIGSRLLAHATDARFLWVLCDNHRGRRFYEHNGWRADGAEQVVFDTTELRYVRDP